MRQAVSPFPFATKVATRKQISIVKRFRKMLSEKELYDNKPIEDVIPGDLSWLDEMALSRSLIDFLFNANWQKADWNFSDSKAMNLDWRLAFVEKFKVIPCVHYSYFVSFTRIDLDKPIFDKMSYIGFMFLISDLRDMQGFIFALLKTQKDFSKGIYDKPRFDCVRLKKSELKFVQECLDAIEKCQISDTKFLIDSVEYNFNIAIFHDLSSFNAACGIEGLHKLVYNPDSQDNLRQYLGRINTGKNTTICEYLFDQYWDSSIEKTKIRLRFALRYKKYPVCEVSSERDGVYMNRLETSCFITDDLFYMLLKQHL